MYNHAGHPALRASGLCRLLRVAAGLPGTLGGRLAPGDLGAGVSPRGPPELPAGPPGRVRAWAARQIIFANATPGVDMAQIERDHEPLLHMLM